MASQQQPRGDGNEKPFVGINRYQVRQLDAFKEGSQFGHEAGSAAVTGIDMQPEFFLLANVPDWAKWVHRTRACRSDGCYHRKWKIPSLPIGSDMLFEALNIDATSAKTRNADHVPFANSDLLRSPRHCKVGRLGSINSRNSSE